MKAWDILGYAYESDVHCVDCARKRFGAALKDPDTTDSEGNPLHPIFASCEHLQPETCGDCLETIPGTEE